MHVLYEERMAEARASAKYCEEKLLRSPAEDGILDVGVSFDSSWMKRGYKSHAGVGFAIEVHTGIVVDLDVLCTYCYICSTKNSQKKTRKKHQCHKTSDGKAGAMEPAIAVRIWSRSVTIRCVSHLLVMGIPVPTMLSVG